MAQPSSIAQRPVSPLVRAAAFAALMTLTRPAFGDVIEIGPDGALAVYNAPNVFGDEGARPIQLGRSQERRSTSHSIPERGFVARAISSAAERYSIDPNLLRGLAWQESHYRHDAVSAKGAVGVMQLMPGTARDLGVDRFDFFQNIFGGAAYLKQMLERYGGDPSLALAAYNAGPNAVDRYRGLPPFLETRTYVKSIMGDMSPSIQFRLPFVTEIDP